jgi:hypothetical protein
MPKNIKQSCKLCRRLHAKCSDEKPCKRCTDKAIDCEPHIRQIRTKNQSRDIAPLQPINSFIDSFRWNIQSMSNLLPTITSFDDQLKWMYLNTPCLNSFAEWIIKMEKQGEEETMSYLEYNQ